MIEWIKALSPIIVAIIPIIVAVYSSARKTRESTSNDIQSLRDRLDEHIRADEEINQKVRRVRILRFADEVSKGEEFADEYWSELCDDIDDYKRYVAKHPLYQNAKGKVAMEYLKEKYKEKFSNGR